MKLTFIIVGFLKALFQPVLLEGNIYTSISGQGLEKENKNDCDHVVTEQYGLIQSPAFPDKYPRYSRCQYTIHRYSSNTCEIKLTIQQFEVAKMTFSNCSADFFEIQNDRKRYKICGEIPTGSKRFVYFPDNSDQLVFKFQSTFHQRRGFSIEIKQLPFSCRKPANITTHESIKVSPPCIQIINGRTGRITYPSFADNDVPIKRCTFKIMKSETSACVVQLDFSSFDVSPSAECKTNYLELPDEQRLCGTLGGSRKMLQFPQESNELILQFVSNADNSNTFDIQVSQLPGPCEHASATNRTGTYDDLEKNVL